MPPLLTIQDLSIDFRLPTGSLRAVDGVSFALPEGGTMALVGESGSGKTTVSRAILRILPRSGRISGGRILFQDPRAGAGGPVDLAALPAESAALRAIRGGRIAMIFQEPMTALSPLHTIGNQVEEALRLHRPVSAREADRLSRDMLRLVGFPDPAKARRAYPFELSGGLRQRAMIAMALVCRPALLVADEPTTALDVTIQAQVLELLRSLQAELGMALLLITHNLGIVANIAQEVVVMYGGKVVESGPVDSVLEHPGHPYLQALLRAVPRLDCGPSERLVPIRDYRRSPAGRALDRRDRAPQADTSTLLALRGVGRSYEARRTGLLGRNGAELIRAVADVDLDIRRGECLALVGESGSGKSTLGKIIVRAIAADQGRITFNDGARETDVLALTGAKLKSYRRRVQLIFQDPFGSLDPRMTVYQTVAEPLIVHELGDEEERRETVAELLRLVGLDPRHMQRYPHSFSGGQRQRIAIARALVLSPDLVICDEPVSALDVSIQAQILNLLAELQQELGLTYLFISHDLSVVNYLASRVAVMCAGRIVEVADCSRLFAEPIHPYTRALLAAVPTLEPGHRFDFAAACDDRVSDPAAWPVPYRIDSSHAPTLVEVGPGHAVRRLVEA